VASLDSVTITSQLLKWKEEAEEKKKLELEQKTKKRMVGTGRFELPHTLALAGERPSQTSFCVQVARDLHEHILGRSRSAVQACRSSVHFQLHHEATLRHQDRFEERSIPYEKR
jgi:hypothetical protein